MAAYNDLDASRMTLQALADGWRCRVHVQARITLHKQSRQEVDAYQCEAILCFLVGARKDAHKEGGDCPGIAVWPLATGPDLPSKREEDAIFKSKYAVLHLTERPAKMEGSILPSVFYRKRSSSPTASVSPAGVCSTTSFSFYRKIYIFSINLEADRKALGIQECSSDLWKSITIS